LGRGSFTSTPPSGDGGIIIIGELIEDRSDGLPEPEVMRLEGDSEVLSKGRNPNLVEKRYDGLEQFSFVMQLQNLEIMKQLSSYNSRGIPVSVAISTTHRSTCKKIS